MLIFAFLVLTLIIFSGLLVLAYFYVKREFEARLKGHFTHEYRKNRQFAATITTLQNNLDQTNANVQQLAMVKTGTSGANFTFPNFRVASEDRHIKDRQQAKEFKVVDEQPIKVA